MIKRIFVIFNLIIILFGVFCVSYGANEDDEQFKITRYSEQCAHEVTIIPPSFYFDENYKTLFLIYHAKKGRWYSCTCLYAYDSDFYYYTNNNIKYLATTITNGLHYKSIDLDGIGDGVFDFSSFTPSNFGTQNAGNYSDFEFFGGNCNIYSSSSLDTVERFFNDTPVPIDDVDAIYDNFINYGDDLFDGDFSSDSVFERMEEGDFSSVTGDDDTSIQNFPSILSNGIKNFFAFFDFINQTKSMANTIYKDLKEVDNGEPVYTLGLQHFTPKDYNGYVNPYFGDIVIDLSWYKPFKHMGDIFITGFVYLAFMWRMFTHASSFIKGVDIGSNIHSDLNNSNES